MIVSHRHKLIFIKALKVAGTSFEVALSKYLGDDDIITPISERDETLRRQVGGRGPQNTNIMTSVPRRRSWFGSRVRPAAFYNHMPARDIFHSLPPNIWATYTKISLIRNPWDVVVSMFYWQCRNSKDSIDFSSWYLRHRPYDCSNERFYFINKKPILDVELIYEELPGCLKRLESIIPSLAGFAENFESIRAKANVRPSDARNLDAIYAGLPQLVRRIGADNRLIIDRYGYAPPSLDRSLRS